MDELNDSTPDAGPALDLSPRPERTRKRRRWPVVVIGLVLLSALGFVLLRGLDDATLFFYNADEALERRDDLGDSRFRLQGTVESDSVESTATGVTFVVTFAGSDVPVEHEGDPPELFQENIPVVLEGQWSGDTFRSDRILVKHSEVYTEENDDRLRDAEEGGGAEQGAGP